MTTTLTNDRTNHRDTKPAVEDARELFASLVSAYREVGLSFHDATRAADADYKCALEAEPELPP